MSVKKHFTSSSEVVRRHRQRRRGEVDPAEPAVRGAERFSNASPSEMADSRSKSAGEDRVRRIRLYFSMPPGYRKSRIAFSAYLHPMGSWRP